MMRRNYEYVNKDNSKIIYTDCQINKKMDVMHFKKSIKLIVMTKIIANVTRIIIFIKK